MSVPLSANPSQALDEVLLRHGLRNGWLRPHAEADYIPDSPARWTLFYNPAKVSANEAESAARALGFHHCPDGKVAIQSRTPLFTLAEHAKSLCGLTHSPKNWKEPRPRVKKLDSIRSETAQYTEHMRFHRNGMA